MKVTYIGCNSRSGISEAKGTAYTIAEVIYMIPDKAGEKRGPDGVLIWTYIAYGNRVRTIPLDSSKISAFSAIKPCTEVDLKLEPIAENPSKNQVVGVA
jgi:hypothetical protein